MGFAPSDLVLTTHSGFHMSDEKTLKEICRQDLEPIGRSGLVTTGADGRNLFSFGDSAKL